MHLQTMDGDSPLSLRWIAILVGMVVLFYQFASPIVFTQRKLPEPGRTGYRDVRVGIILWLFLAALLHTPAASSHVEDHPSRLYISVFMLLLVTTHLTLAGFTLLHHIFVWTLQLFFPSMAHALWVPALRGVRSFRGILQSSVILSGVLSFVFVYCTVFDSQDLPYFASGICTPSFVVPRGSTKYGSVGAHLFGFDPGRVSLLESPIGMLWLSGIAMYAMHYTLRRTARINQELSRRQRRAAKLERLREQAQALGMDPGNMGIDDEYDSSMEDDDINVIASRITAPERSGIGHAQFEKRQELVEWLENVKDIAAQRWKRDPSQKKKVIRPKDFLPMSEWYSLAVADVGFQFIISMKLFLGRFDMRMLQAAFLEHEDEPFVQQERDEMLHSRSKHKEDIPVFVATNPTRRYRPVGHGFDGRYAKLEDLWFDFIADTGDGGNSTYAVARAAAQPVLKVRDPDCLVESFARQSEEEGIQDEDDMDEEEEYHENHQHQNVENCVSLKRGLLLLLGGDLAYPTASEDMYNARLFRPFHYAMESPSSNDTISPGVYPWDSFLRQQRSSGSPRQLESRRSSQGSVDDMDVDAFVYGRGNWDTSLASNQNGPKTNLRVRTVSDHFGEVKRNGATVEVASSARIEEETSTFEAKSFTSSNCDSQTVGEDENKDKPQQWCGPPCAYAIPGNHDWYDGLHTFLRCICHRDWLGGWRLPQRRSYFALRLPHNWWVFGFDFALIMDIDPLQYQYFARVIEHNMGPDDQAIIVTHEPTWLLDSLENYPNPFEQKHCESPNLKQLMRRHLKGRVALRITGDVHNYIRHDINPKSSRALETHGAPLKLVTAGGGGAFLHPTHCFPTAFRETGAKYRMNTCYPSFGESRRVGRLNLGWGFRRLNWKFDIVSAGFYFSLVVSFFPRCNLEHIMGARTIYPDALREFVLELFEMFLELWTDSVISLVIFLVSWGVLVYFADPIHGTLQRVVIGTMHVGAHLVSAFSLFLLLEITVETAILDGLAGHGYDTLFNDFREFERRQMPSTWRTSGLLEKVFQVIARIFDMPENMAWTRAAICSNTHQAYYQSHLGLYNNTNTNAVVELTRFDMLGYYVGNLLYLFVITADVAAIVFGFYLYFCVSILDLHWNEGFSSLRYEHYKNFVRFRIDRDGDLHVYAIGLDRVPETWKQDPSWSSTWERRMRSQIANNSRPHELDPCVASYAAMQPSRWKSDTKHKGHRSKEKAKIIDYFCIRNRKRLSKLEKTTVVVGTTKINSPVVRHNSVI